MKHKINLFLVLALGFVAVCGAGCTDTHTVHHYPGHYRSFEAPPQVWHYEAAPTPRPARRSLWGRLFPRRSERVSALSRHSFTPRNAPGYSRPRLFARRRR